MELGRIAEIDQAQVSNTQKVQKVQELEQKQKIDPNEQHKKAIGTEANAIENEVILDNVKFGYNKNSRDFFVKITKGEAEYKFPTESMMKLKAHLLDLMSSQSKS
jgi:uncharacterized FlaG/YvyC family protein